MVPYFVLAACGAAGAEDMPETDEDGMMQGTITKLNPSSRSERPLPAVPLNTFSIPFMAVSKPGESKRCLQAEDRNVGKYLWDTHTAESLDKML